MCSGKFITRAGINGYGTLLTGDKKIPEDDTDKTKDEGVTTVLKLINKIAYNDLILTQEDTVCFKIVEEENSESHKYLNSEQA